MIHQLCSVVGFVKEAVKKIHVVLPSWNLGVNKTPAREIYCDVKRSKTAHYSRIRERAPPNGPFFGAVPFRAPASLPRTAFCFRLGESFEAFAKRWYTVDFLLFAPNGQQKRSPGKRLLCADKGTRTPTPVRHQILSLTWLPITPYPLAMCKGI